jgi:hypothetical protein
MRSLSMPPTIAILASYPDKTATDIALARIDIRLANLDRTKLQPCAQSDPSIEHLEEHSQFSSK